MKKNREILQNRIPLEEAVERIYEAVKPLAETECDLEAADGTILSESYQAQYDQPPFPRSPLDGYALRGEEERQESIRWYFRWLINYAPVTGVISV